MAGDHQSPAAATVVSGSPSHSQHDDADPTATAPAVAEQSPPQQPPHSETLDFQKPPQSPLHEQNLQIPQQSDEHEDTIIIPDAYNQQSEQKFDQSGRTHTKTLIPPRSPPLKSHQRRRRKTYNKHKSTTKKIENLTKTLNLIPFIPNALDLRKHENVLKRLGLYNFSKMKLDRNIRTDLLVQFIANYDPKKKCSYVNDKRIRVNRADLARALQLPAAKQDNKEVDLDSEVFSAEEIGFIDDFVFNWILLYEESWILPAKIVNLTRCVRHGHPEKLDSASLIWYKVEKELTEGVILIDCYYASHLQQLIRSQCDQLLEVDDHVDEVKEDVKDDEEHKEKVSIVQEDDVELTFGPDVELTSGHETMEEQVDCKNNLGEHMFLQRCQTSDVNNNEEIKVEDVVDENDDDENNDGEKFVEGFDMETNDDSIDLFASRDDSFMSHGGPSFFDNNNNNGKRVMESDEETHHLDTNNKRLKTDDTWDHKQSDFGLCMVQMEQWLEKAKMITDSKQQIYVNHNYHQDSAMNELQNRQQVMEMIIKSKDEELEQKHAEVYRLERELYLMGDLLSGYRTALNDTRVKFSEYRKRVGIQEEAAYKDVGPGGLVLSTRELEEQRLKQEEEEEEDMMKFQICAKGFEEEWVYQLEMLHERVVKMDEKLVFVGNEVKRLNEIAAKRKETKKARDEVELSPKREDPDNDASMEIVSNDTDESEEKGGGEEH